MSDKTRLNDIAGYCPEKAIWKFLVDLSTTLLKDNSHQKLCPENIVVDGEFFLLETVFEQEELYMAPDQITGNEPTCEQMIWTIGALIYYLSTGRIIFGGHGGCYQREHPQAPLPALPKVHNSLTPVMRRCLSADPSNRISQEELYEIANKGLIECSRYQRGKGSIDANDEVIEKVKIGIWPEEMKEI